MINLIVTPDDSGYREDIYSFIVYDLEEKTIIHKRKKQEELDCKHLEGQGRHTFRPFGIETNGNYIFIVSNDRIGVFNRSSFEFIGILDIPLYVNTHQIILNDGVLYSCDTSVNAIGIHTENESKQFNLNDFKICDTLPKPKDVYSDDSKHVNSLYEYEGKIYFCLHNKNKKMSKFGYFDKKSFECRIIASAGYSCHNIRIIDKKLYSLSSGSGDIVEINLQDNSVIYYPFVNHEKTFLRGLDSINEYLIIGASNNHNSKMLENNCFISAFNTKTKQINRVMDLQDVFVITDLKIIEGYNNEINNNTI